MLNSMTGFTSLSGAFVNHTWIWELRGVNGKGLDIRLRLPDWIDGLDAEVRARLSKALSRGNLNVSLRVRSLPAAGKEQLDAERVDVALTALQAIEAKAAEKGVSLAPSRSIDILALRGVFEDTADEGELSDLRTAILEGFDQALSDFLAARQAEGQALATVVSDQFDRIETLTEQATAQAVARRPEAEAQLRAALGRVSTLPDLAVDEARIAQELALLAVKADVTEELDRLKTHCDAGRALLRKGSPLGRKLDFLTQEFNREANTLCAKSQSKDLTATGLELKSVIEQMREQVQNVE